jgi:anti-anti-sigma factor
MRHQVPFVGERKVVRANDDGARAKRTSGRIIDDVVGNGVTDSSWDDVVPPGWIDKSQPKKNTSPESTRVSVAIPKPHVPFKPGSKPLVPGADTKPKASTKTSGAYSGSITFSDSASLDWIPINNGRGLRVNIHGCIDHDLRKEWSRLLNDTEAANIREFEFNLTETPGLSLTGLGMLLLFKERKGSVREDIKLCNCNSEVKQLLEWTGMDKYFLIQTTQISN